jgi:ABC-type multidrug transport system ATPase subunit
VALIEVTDLSRTFKVRGRPPVEAVKDLSLSIDAGEMVGYIGPNGAGKSTTVRISPR